MKHNKVKIDVIEELTIRLKLIWRLIKVFRRIDFSIFGFFYLPMPDLFSDHCRSAPSDSWIAALFVQLCPAKIVDEHMNELRNVIPGEWQEKDADEGQGNASKERISHR